MDIVLFILMLIFPIIPTIVVNIKRSNFTIAPDKSILSRPITDSLRGIAILIIIISHYSVYMGAPMLGPFGGMGVAIFLFISGFGLNESFKKNGLSGFWHKKISRVMIPYWITLVIISILYWHNFHLREFLFDIFGIKTSYWYIGFILRWYIIEIK